MGNPSMGNPSEHDSLLVKLECGERSELILERVLKRVLVALAR